MQHYETTVDVQAEPHDVFDFIDDHEQFSSHMNRSSWMMGGGSMATTVDAGHGNEVGSHIRMVGKVFGVSVALDEVVTEHEPPLHKSWETVGEPRLLVVGGYHMDINVAPAEHGSRIRVSIDYEMPKRRKWLGRLFGGLYARWCVSQMANGVSSHFTAPAAVSA